MLNSKYKTPQQLKNLAQPLYDITNIFSAFTLLPSFWICWIYNTTT